MNWLEDRDGKTNPVYAGTWAEQQRHEHVRSELAKYKQSLEDGLITEEQFEAIRTTLLQRAGLAPQ